jgi:enoyl-[acyl-carrier protein] reductase II
VLRTAVCDLLGIKYPIVQGGMAHVGTAELVAAVSNAGGLGIIGAGHYPADWVRQQIIRTRELTTHPFGVNLPLTSPELGPVIEAVLAQRVGIVATGAGDPSALIPRFKQAGIRVMAVVGTVALA